MKSQSFRVGGILLFTLLFLLAVERFDGGNLPPIADERLRIERVLNKSQLYTPGIELQNVYDFLGGEKISLSDFTGKNVTLLFFWSSTCSPCVEEVRRVERWTSTYNGSGLSIVGVHIPEFGFQNSRENVELARKELGVSFLTVLDNTENTFEAYGSKSLPFFALIDIDGFLRFAGGSESSESVEELFRGLLIEREELFGNVLSLPERTAYIPSRLFDSRKFKNIYVGSEYGRHDFGNPQGLRQGFTLQYTLPPYPSSKKVYADGLWRANADSITLEGEKGRLLLVSDARRVSIVAGSNENVSLKVSVNSIPTGEAIIQERELYSVAEFGTYETRELLLEFSRKDVSVYKLTLE